MKRSVQGKIDTSCKKYIIVQGNFEKNPRDPGQSSRNLQICPGFAKSDLVTLTTTESFETKKFKTNVECKFILTKNRILNRINSFR